MPSVAMITVLSTGDIEPPATEWFASIPHPTALLAAFLLALLLVLVGVRLAAMFDQTDSPPLRAETTTVSGRDAATDRGTEQPITGGQVACRYCGTANEPGYTYCRACINRLSDPQGG
ncbi:MAG: hypothetical protein SVG88_04295 [Halobacteriales archaeon]|nr:hypothetical protein [Halobacteriales archaeon]